MAAPDGRPIVREGCAIRVRRLSRGIIRTLPALLRVQHWQRESSSYLRSRLDVGELSVQK